MKIFLMSLKYTTKLNFLFILLVLKQSFGVSCIMYCDAGEWIIMHTIYMHYGVADAICNIATKIAEQGNVKFIAE